MANVILLFKNLIVNPSIVSTGFDFSTIKCFIEKEAVNKFVI